ncbi:MAG: tetratricopeptide repeat protein [Parasporobacterium sp.]|nr:tetratricopeptide repeat protein [Parasporobacterium sp.]
MFLSKEDYEEPRCLLCKPTEVAPIPVGRVLGKLDEYLGKNDYPAAERHLKYWLMEAETGNDKRGMLTVSNEMIGLYRKAGREQECMEAAESVRNLLSDPDLDEEVTRGTSLINIATGYKAFGKTAEALPLYEEAMELYEKNLKERDSRLGGLYNNMAITLTALGEYDRAEELYGKALHVMSLNENGETDMAITYCNMADLTAARCDTGTEGITLDAEAERKIGEYLETARRLLDTETLPRDGYHAFVCEKCAPTFGYYGFFADEKELSERSEQIRRKL